MQRQSCPPTEAMLLILLLDPVVLLCREHLLNVGSLVCAGQSINNVPLADRLTSSTLLGEQRE